MKFTVSSTSLSSHLQAISRVINAKSSLPILDNFLFKIEDGILTLTASDLDTTLITSMEVAQSDGNGVVAISAKLLLDILKEFSDQPIEFDINDSTLSIKMRSGSGDYNLIGQNGDEYPKVPSLADDAKGLMIPTQTLLTGINKTLFATADDVLRQVMNGIFFDISAENVTFVASDAHKLVRVKTTAAKGSEACSFILPKKPTNLLKNILPKEDGDVALKFDSKNACFTLSNYTMYCRLIEGRFPNYNSVIPTDNPYKAMIDRSAFMNMLRRVSVFSNQATNLIRLDFTKDSITASAQDLDFSVSAKEALNCQYEGEDMSIGFQSSFLIEILSNLGSTDITFELSDPTRAGLIIPFDQESEEDTLMLLMPMSLND
ncbi:MAG: DNA polymerase III subunit beta [Paludibacteraceae bacterium]|nr:DNA polymerase III subunit beta [Paludibacteraceae bacterium]